MLECLLLDYVGMMKRCEKRKAKRRDFWPFRDSSPNFKKIDFRYVREKTKSANSYGSGARSDISIVLLASCYLSRSYIERE